MSEKKFSPEDVLKILRACTAYGKTFLERCAECPANNGSCADFSNEVVAADAIEELLAQVRWIPVGERLPELIPCSAGPGHGYSEAVQICTDGRKVLTAVYSHEGWIFGEGFCEAWGESVTHWRPVVGNQPCVAVDLSAYSVCPECGAHLDPGEICDCQTDELESYLSEEGDG